MNLKNHKYLLNLPLFVLITEKVLRHKIKFFVQNFSRRRPLRRPLGYAAQRAPPPHPPGVPHDAITFLELMQHGQLLAILSDLYHCEQRALPAVSTNPDKKFRVRAAKVLQTRRCEPKVGVRSRCDQISFLGHQVIQLL